MDSDISVLKNIIERRRSVMPSTYNGRAISRETLEAILESANHAPTHKLTQPWHFVVFRGSALEELGSELSNIYRDTTASEKFSDRKMAEIGRKAVLSSAVIAIIMEVHPELLPEWEEVAATATAVENMWLTATAHGVGAYWSSPGAIHHLGSFLELPDNQRCIGLFYMGYSDVSLPPSQREDIAMKVRWRE